MTHNADYDAPQNVLARLSNLDLKRAAHVMRKVAKGQKRKPETAALLLNLAGELESVRAAAHGVYEAHPVRRVVIDPGGLGGVVKAAAKGGRSVESAVRRERIVALLATVDGHDDEQRDYWQGIRDALRAFDVPTCQRCGAAEGDPWGCEECSETRSTPDEEDQ